VCIVVCDGLKGLPEAVKRDHPDMCGFRRVVRAPAGTCSMASVNEPRSQ
jgi:hypothetical protein